MNIRRYLILFLFVCVSHTIIGQNHFTTVWSGNPYQAMNIYVTLGTLNDVNLEAGDEIGVFDGSLCVGVGVLTGPILPGNPLAIVASTDDPTTPETDGFTPGNIITFRYWDNSNSVEIEDVVPNYISENEIFISLGTAVVELQGSTTVVPPDINVVPASWDYGNVLVGSNPSKTFVVENLGDVDLIVTSTTLTGTNASEFSLDNGGAPFTVFPNESHDVVVSFNPTSVGSKICTLKIDNNDPDSFENPKYVPLTGSGTTGIPVGINPASDFGGCDKDIVIPIVVGDLTGQGIISFQFTVEFDEALLITTIGFDNNADIDFGDWIVQYNASTPGQISVAGFGSTQLRGSGVLLYLLFHTSSDDGFTSPLNFAAFTFNNGTPLASTTNGSITLRCCICGDADGDEEVLAFDAALTLQHVLEIITLENPECVDVDEDGEVLAFDAALILHCVLGLTPPVSTCCSANVTINRAGYLEKVNLNIELKEIQQLHDETIIVLYFTGFNSTEEVSAIQFDLELPNDETDLELFELPEEYFSEINKIENSLYRVGIVNPYGIDASEIKLILKSKIDISSNIFQFSKIYINSRAQNDINTFLPGRFIPEDYNIGAYPNPFNPNTRIIYSIPVKTNVEIKVFDILGREVIKLIDQEFEAGIREVKWDATNRFGLPVSSGTFIITIKTDKFFRAIKISHIK